MSDKLQPPRGTKDYFGADAATFSAIVDAAKSHAQNYGFAEIFTPIFEFSGVFHRSLGDASDIVGKETYDFEDRGGEGMTLRPEFTASIARAFISNAMYDAAPCKFFYSGPAFRYERPQKGRQRQFHQFGVELLGVDSYVADVEVIALAARILDALNVKNTLYINSLGDAESRANHRAKLVEYFEKYKSDLSEDSQNRLQKNPLRILDSKDEGDKKIAADAPKLKDFLNAPSKDFFQNVLGALENLKINYELDDNLVRGLDYYNHTIFEFKCDELGAQDTVLSGGRYDGLVEMLGGKPTAGVGFAAGIERLMLTANLADVQIQKTAIIADDITHAIRAAEILRAKNKHAEIIYSGNFSKKMKKADKLGATEAIIIGEDEINGGFFTVKNLKTGDQKQVAESDL